MALDKKTTNAVYALHKGLGARDAKLPVLVHTTALAQRWRIVNSDVSNILRAKVIYRLEQIFRTMSPLDALAAPVVYNTVVDLTLHDAQLGQRKDNLPLRFPELSLSDRTISRIIQRLGLEVERSVDHPCEPFNDHMLDVIIRREQDFAVEIERQHGNSVLDRLVQAVYIAPQRPAHRALLAHQLVTSLSTTGQLIIARTPLGDWVCAFGTVEALRAHQVATPQQNCVGRVIALPGADLVRNVLARPRPTGVVFNPTPVRSGDARSTLRLTPTDVADLAKRL